jgi:hypothetical protein
MITKNLLKRLYPFMLIVGSVLLPIAMAVPASAQSLFVDGFESGTAPTGGTFVANPFPSDPHNDSLQCLKVSASGSTSWGFSGITASSGQDLQLSMQVDEAGVGAYGAIRGALMSANGTGSGQYGYGVEIDGGSTNYTVKIIEYNNVAAWNAPTALTSTTIPVSGGGITTTAWNNVVFTWSTRGAMSVSINGEVVLTWTDTTIATGVLATNGLAIWTFNNNANLAIDNIQVTSVPGVSTSLFTDGFESGTAPAGGTFVANPFPSDLNNDSAQCLKVAASGSTYWEFSGTASSGQDLQLSMQVDEANVGQYGTVHGALFSSNGSGGTQNGYGFIINGGTTNYTVQVVEYSNLGIWQTPTGANVLATASIPLTNTGVGGITTTGWNNVVFTWTTSGGLSLSLNGAIVLNTSNTAIATGVLATNGTGIYQYNNNANMAIDNVQVTQLGGIPLGAALLGYTNNVINEYPLLTDIAPGVNGDYTWFNGSYLDWKGGDIFSQPSLSNYANTGGANAVLAMSLGGSITSTPLDMTTGALPVLAGANGFYVEFTEKLSSNNVDHDPAVWLESVEHSAHQPGQTEDGYTTSLYPGDPVGTERWLELDVDEGGYGNGGSSNSWHGTAISRVGKFGSYVETPYGPVGTTTPDRTQWHTFAASYNPSTNTGLAGGTGGTVTWYMDGVQTAQTPAGSLAVPFVATLQHFYLIADPQSMGASTPYTMSIGSIRAYIPPAWNN